MAVLKIHVFGDSILRAKAVKVTSVDQSLRNFIQDMADTLYAAGGIGLAANQLGDTRSLIVVDVDQVDTTKPRGSGKRRVIPSQRKLQVFINPEIVECGPHDESYTEGCLSFPGVDAEVFRPTQVKVRFMNMDGATREIEAEGLLARVMQHEIDHLNGVVFLDRVSPDKRRTMAGEVARLRELAAKNPGGI